MAEAAADAGVPPRALPAALQGARAGVERGRASAWLSGGAGGQGRVASSVAVQRGGSVRARAKRALWARPEHARQVFDEMPARSTELGRGW